VHQAEEGVTTVAAIVAVGATADLSFDDDRPFILPMSGRSWKSITAGIPILAARSSPGALRSERRVDF
jgi:hypothetical protein